MIKFLPLTFPPKADLFLPIFTVLINIVLHVTVHYVIIIFLFFNLFTLFTFRDKRNEMVLFYNFPFVRAYLSFSQFSFGACYCADVCVCECDLINEI